VASRRIGGPLHSLKALLGDTAGDLKQGIGVALKKAVVAEGI
jgi:hypothetical protein